MWLVVTAALACALPSQGPARAPSVMSLPLDGGPASLAELEPIASGLATPPAFAADGLTPLVVECADEAATQPPAPDCASGPASRWTADMIGSCDMPRPSRGRPALLRRARPLVASAGVAGSISAAEELLAPDSQSLPPLAGSAASLIHRLEASTLSPAPRQVPPSSPSRRIDRPPRV